MNSNVISQEDLGDLLRNVYMVGLSEGASDNDSDWDSKTEDYSDYLIRVREEKIKMLAGKYRIK